MWPLASPTASLQQRPTPGGESLDLFFSCLKSLGLALLATTLPALSLLVGYSSPFLDWFLVFFIFLSTGKLCLHGDGAPFVMTSTPSSSRPLLPHHSYLHNTPFIDRRTTLDLPYWLPHSQLHRFSMADHLLCLVNSPHARSSLTIVRGLLLSNLLHLEISGENIDVSLLPFLQSYTGVQHGVKPHA